MAELGRGRTVGLLILAFASGFPFGVINDFLPLYLKAHGVSLAEIGLSTLLTLPWTIKPLWAPLVDRLGSRRAWILGGLGLVTVATALLPWAPVSTELVLWGDGFPRSVSLLVVLMFLIAMGGATQDIAIDGTVATAVPKGQEGRANGLRVAAYRGAMALTGGGAAALGNWLGWSLAFMGMAVVLGMLLVGVWFSPLKAETPERESGGEWWKSLGNWLLEPEAWLLFGMALLFKLGDSALGPMVKPFWVDQGLSVEETALFSTSVGAGLAALGALAGGDWMTRMGAKKGILVLGVVHSVAILGYVIAASVGGRIAIYSASIVESFAIGLGSAVLLAAFSLAARGSQAATRFAVLSAIVGLTRSLAGALSGTGVEAWGYPLWFAVCFALSLPGLFLAFWASRRWEE